jgi:hypothetical protein
MRSLCWAVRCEDFTIGLRAVAPGVVVATTVAWADGFTTPAGHVEPPSRNVLTQVFVRRDGRWLVTDGHNTTVVEEAQRSNPVK